MTTARIIFASISLALVSIGAAVLPAQPVVDGETPRTFRILSVVGSYDGLLYQTDSKSPPHPLALSRALSRSLPAPAGPLLEIFREIPPPPGAPAGTPPTREVALTATLDITATETVVVARPITPGNKQTLFQGQVLTPGKDFHAGNCFVANLTPFPSASVLIKKEIHTVTQGATKIISFEQGHIVVKVALSNVTHWKLAGSDAWRLNESYRGYIFILPYIEDPDYPPPFQPPPALVRINFEISPEIRRQKNAVTP